VTPFTSPYAMPTQQQDPDARKLAAELDGLPLALATAGTYLHLVPDSFAEYLQSYEESWLQLQQDTPQLLSYEDRTLYTTWGISFDHVRQQSSLATKLLQLWAYFDSQDVWLQLLQEGRDNAPEWFRELTRDRLVFNKAVRILCNHALVEADAASRDDSVESRGYSMHGCVHVWTTNVVNERWDGEMARLALRCVGLHVPSETALQYWVTQQRLLRHANRFGGYIDAVLAGQYDDMTTIEATHNLGNLYADQGKLDKAEEMYERALEGKEKALGHDHTSTLDTVNNLGNLYVNQGKLDKAEEMYERALEGCEKALGRDHTSTLNIVNNLGILYANQGKLDEAEEMYKRALEGKEKALGRDHTSTLNIVNNLGILYANQGKLDKAEEMYERALEGYEKALGHNHTSTLHTVNNLGSLYVDQGKLDKAEEMYERALEGYEKALRHDHTSTLHTVNNLGSLYLNQGKLDEAEEMYKWALEGKEKALRHDHTSTLYTVHNLGNLYANQGKLDEAEEMYKRALEGYEKRFDSNHSLCHSLRRALTSLRDRVET
jgi:tetratricopeptide (TPR) repeat protein